MVADNGETEQTLKQGFWALVRATGRSLIDLIRFDSIRFVSFRFVPFVSFGRSCLTCTTIPSTSGYLL